MFDRGGGYLRGGVMSSGERVLCHRPPVTRSNKGVGSGIEKECYGWW